MFLSSVLTSCGSFSFDDDDEYDDDGLFDNKLQMTLEMEKSPNIETEDAIPEESEITTTTVTEAETTTTTVTTTIVSNELDLFEVNENCKKQFYNAMGEIDNSLAFQSAELWDALVTVTNNTIKVKVPVTSSVDTDLLATLTVIITGLLCNELGINDLELGDSGETDQVRWSSELSSGDRAIYFYVTKK